MTHPAGLKPFAFSASGVGLGATHYHRLPVDVVRLIRHKQITNWCTRKGFKRDWWASAAESGPIWVDKIGKKKQGQSQNINIDIYYADRTLILTLLIRNSYQPLAIDGMSIPRYSLKAKTSPKNNQKHLPRRLMQTFDDKKAKTFSIQLRGNKENNLKHFLKHFFFACQQFLCNLQVAKQKVKVVAWGTNK